MKKGVRGRLFLLGLLALAFVIILSVVVAKVVYRYERHRGMAETMNEEESVSANEVSEDREALEQIKEGLENGTPLVETLRPLYPDDIILDYGGKCRFIPIKEDVKRHQYKEEQLRFLENGELQYMENGEVISHKGIDVSKFQGDIDWEKVADDGVEFVIIRALLRGYGTGKLVVDERFEDNIQGALGAGLKVGVYVFTQAMNEEEALEEANMVLDLIRPYKVECPVVFDVERIMNADGRMNHLTVEERTEVAVCFCKTIKEAGYRPMIYHNSAMALMWLDLSRLEEYDKWFAYYEHDLYYPYEYKLWQYSEKGKVNGINTDVDLNISFGPLW